MNPRPSDYKSDALPTELRQHSANRRNITKGHVNCKGTLWKTCANLTLFRWAQLSPYPHSIFRLRAGRIILHSVGAILAAPTLARNFRFSKSVWHAPGPTGERMIWKRIECRSPEKPARCWSQRFTDSPLPRRSFLRRASARRYGPCLSCPELLSDGSCRSAHAGLYRFGRRARFLLLPAASGHAGPSTVPTANYADFVRVHRI